MLRAEPRLYVPDDPAFRPGGGSTVKTSSKPRLVYYSDCVAFGGCENVLVNLINSPMVRKHYDVVFVYRAHRKYEEGRRLRITGVHTVPVRLLSNDSIFYSWSISGMPRPLLRVLKLPLLALECTGIYAAANFLILWVVFAVHKAGIVHINNGGYPAAATCLTAVWSARAAGARRVVFTVNNIATPRRFPWDAFVDAVTAKLTDRFVTASVPAQQALIERRGIPPGRIRRIPNALQPVRPARDRTAVLREFRMEHKRAVLCEVGLLQHAKGQVFLLEAVVRLCREHPEFAADLVLFLVGEGEDRGRLDAMVHRYRLQETVVLTGQRADYADFIAAADVFVLPSVANEDMPLVILAAMSLGIPVVSTRIAGIPEQIRDGVDGVLLDPARLAEELPVTLERLLRSPEERARLADSARRRHGQLFSVDAVVNAYSSLYENGGPFRNDRTVAEGAA
jgi:glycosyltransferase involved in cell wall biosynthesis